MKRLLELGAGRWAHASGALWLPAHGTAIIADAHLGYGWAQRRRGELGPLRDDSLAPRLLTLCDELLPRTVVFLGDFVHAPFPAPEEKELIVGTIEAVAARAAVIIVRGNHDRGFARDFAGLGYTTVPEWRSDGILAVHGDRLPVAVQDHLLIGHFHPVLAPRDAAGAKQRVPVFAWTPKATVLPAFSPFAAGCDLLRHWPPALDTVLGAGDISIAASTGNAVLKIPFRQPLRK